MITGIFTDNHLYVSEKILVVDAHWQVIDVTFFTTTKDLTFWKITNLLIDCKTDLEYPVHVFLIWWFRTSQSTWQSIWHTTLLQVAGAHLIFQFCCCWLCSRCCQLHFHQFLYFRSNLMFFNISNKFSSQFVKIIT